MTPLEEIIRFIKQKDLKPMISWSKRKGVKETMVGGGHWYRLRTKIRHLLYLISGHDIVAMLKSRFHGFIYLKYLNLYF